MIDSSSRKWRPVFPLVCLMLMPSVVRAFTFNEVVDQARTLSTSEYTAPEPAPQFLRDLSYSRYQSIQFRPESSIWRNSGSPFQIMMVQPGSVYSHAVELNVVDGKGVRAVPFRKSDFSYPDEELGKRVPADLGYAGFKLTYPLENPESSNQFLVFGGASYFRGVGKGQVFGLSGRAVTVNTGLPSGEEFPSFTKFWLVRPANDAEKMVIFGLLDGPSLTGAYRFTVSPGKNTVIDVDARLFYRNDVEQPGLAPLTSMFYYGENSLKPRGQWRPEVHDSDGLVIHDQATGEWLWRPLVNPEKLRLSYHTVERLAGFGLMQRDQQFNSYEDNEARYENRPSGWVEPKGDWGSGQVALVEIPSKSEANDNIVAFWTPDEPALAGDADKLSYRLHFGQPGISQQPAGHATATFIGGSEGADATENAFRFVIDFEDGPLDPLGADAAVISNVSGGEGVEVLEHFVQYVEAKDVWRLSVLARPDRSKGLSLRGFLSLDGEPLTETWTYELGVGSALRQQPE
ncbi:glucan biosynthesis protein G [Marinobacter alexandrii]|uniref:glucan biosynthesis protein G n=1 Tax=Marinobacter alexandrii TaxID=2570351 RepID=UPI0011082411|nr:glucan biosynthesis protein G [Marinobacter alexandrii]